MAVVEQMAAVRSDDYVFPGTGGGGTLGKTALPNVLRRLECACTVHGFRATFRSWAADQRVPHEVAEMALGHAIAAAVVRAYQRSDLFEQRRRLMDAWARYCAEPDAGGAEVVAPRRDSLGSPAAARDCSPKDWSSRRLPCRPAVRCRHEAANWPTIHITSRRRSGRGQPGEGGCLRAEAEEREAAESAPEILERYHAGVREADEPINPPPDQPWPSQAAADMMGRGEWPPIPNRAPLKGAFRPGAPRREVDMVLRFRRSGTSGLRVSAPWQDALKYDDEGS